MSVFGDLADDLKLRAEDLGPQLTQKQVESLPMGVDYKPTYKANERPFLYPGETEEERIKDTKDTKKTFDDAMSRYVSMQAGGGKSGEQDSALNELSASMGYQEQSPLQYEDFFKKFREDEALRANPLAQKIAGIEIQKRTGYQIPDEKVADVFGTIIDFDENQKKVFEPKLQEGQSTAPIKGTYKDEAGNIQVVTYDRIQNEQDLQRRQRKAMATSKFGAPEAVLMGMDLDSDLAKAFLDKELDAVNVPLYRTSDGAVAFDVNKSRSKLTNMYYNELINASGETTLDQRDRLLEAAQKRAKKKVSEIMHTNLGVFFVDADPQGKTKEIRENPWFLGDIPVVGGALATAMGPIRATFAGVQPVDASFNRVRTTMEDQGLLDYIGSVALSTSVGSAIHAGGWNTPEHIEMIRRGYDITDDFGNIAKIFTPKFLEKESVAASNKARKEKGLSEFPLPDATFETLAGIGPMIGLILVDPDPTLLLGPIGKGFKAASKTFGLGSAALQANRLETAQGLVKRLASMTDDEIEAGGFATWLDDVNRLDQDLARVFGERLKATQGLPSSSDASAIMRHFEKKKSNLKKAEEDLIGQEKELRKEGDTLAKKQRLVRLKEAKRENDLIRAKIEAEEAAANLLASKKATLSVQPEVLRNASGKGFVTSDREIVKLLKPLADDFDARREVLRGLQKQRLKVQDQQKALVKKAIIRPGEFAAGVRPTDAAAITMARRNKAFTEIERYFSSMSTIEQQKFLSNRSLYKNLAKNQSVSEDFVRAMQEVFPKPKDLRAYLSNRRKLVEIHNRINTSDIASSRYFVTDKGMQTYGMNGTPTGTFGKAPSVKSKDVTDPLEPIVPVETNIEKSLFLSPAGTKELERWSSAITPTDLRVKPLKQTARIDGEDVVFSAKGRRDLRIPYGTRARKGDTLIDVLKKTDNIKGYINKGSVKEVIERSGDSLTAQLGRAIGAKGFISNYDNYVKARGAFLSLSMKGKVGVDELKAIDRLIRDNAEKLVKADSAIRAAREGTEYVGANFIKGLAKEFDRSIDIIKPKLLENKTLRSANSPLKGAVTKVSGGLFLKADILRKNLDDVFGKDAVTQFLARAEDGDTIAGSDFVKLINGGDRRIVEQDITSLRKGITELTSRADSLVPEQEILGRSLMNEMRSEFNIGLKNRSKRRKFSQDYKYKSFVLDLQDSLKLSVGSVAKAFKTVTTTGRAAGYTPRIADAYKTAIEVRGSLTQDLDLLLASTPKEDHIDTIVKYFGTTTPLEVKGGNYPETYMNAGPVSLFEQAARQAISNLPTIQRLSTTVESKVGGDPLAGSFTKVLTKDQKIDSINDITQKLKDVDYNARKFVDMAISGDVKGFSKQEVLILDTIKDEFPKDMKMNIATDDAMKPGVRGYYSFQTNLRNNKVTPIGIVLRGIDEPSSASDAALRVAGVNPITVVHELLHAATVQKMSDFAPLTREGRRAVKMSDEAKAGAQSIIDIRKHLVSVFSDDKLLAKYAPDLTEQQVKVMRANLRRRMALKTEAGPYELITYALTDPDFQSILAKVASPDEIKGRAESLWSKLVTGMSKLLGLEKAGVKNSVLARVIDASDQLITGKASSRADAPGDIVVSTMTKEDDLEKVFNKTLRSLSRAFIPRNTEVTPRQAGALANKAADLMGQLVREGNMGEKEFQQFMNSMRSFTAVILNKKQVASKAEAYAWAKAALVNGVTIDEASKVAMNTFGDMTDELVDDMNAIMKGDFGSVGGDAFDAARATRAMNKLIEMGLPTTTRKIKSDVGEMMSKTSRLVKMSEDAEGMSGFAPAKLVEEIEQLSGDIVKSLELQVNKPGGDLFARSLLSLKQMMGLFRASVTSGLMLPNPRYWLNNIVGDFAQIWYEENLAMASRLTIQNLPANLPFIGRPVQNALFRASESLEGTPILGPVINALYNPTLNKLWTGKSSEVVKMRDGTSYTVGELRRMLAIDGAMDTFAQETLVEGLRKQTGKVMMEYGLKKGFERNKILQMAKKSTTALNKHATFVQQRQRAALYLEYLNRGYSREDARKGMMNALYDWKRPLGSTEVNVLAQIFTFWRFQRLATEQLFRSFMLATRDGGTSRKLMGVPLPSRGQGARSLGRIREMEQNLDVVPAAVYHTMGTGEEGQASTYKEVIDAFYRDIPFWWQGSRATAFSMPIMNGAVKKWYEDRGYDFTYQDVVIPPFTPLDMANQYLGAAAWVYGFSTAGVTGKGMSPDAASELLINPLTAATSPLIQAPLELMLKDFSGGTQYIGSGRAYLRPYEVDLMTNKFLFGGVKRDKDNRPYVEGEANKILSLVRMMPFLGTQLPQYYAAVDNPGWVEGLGKGTSYMLQKLLGIAPRPKNPERELLYPVKEREQDLSREVRSSKGTQKAQDYEADNF